MTAPYNPDYLMKLSADADKAREKINPETLMTPFIPDGRNGWTLLLRAGRTLEWGHRFDAAIGYRVFIKFSDSVNINAFPSDKARKLSMQLQQHEIRPEIITIAKAIRELARQVEKLNKAWADAGAPDEPLDQIKGAGNA